MLVKAAINGGRTRVEHAAVPVSPEEQAADVVECLKAGAGAIHLHVRSTSSSNSKSAADKNSRQDACAPSECVPRDDASSAEKESLEAEDVARTILAVRAVAPNEQIGISTGAWILPHPARLQAVTSWEVLPGFASVNFSEVGAVELAELLLSRGVAVEAGLCDAEAAQLFSSSDLITRWIRVLIEPQEQELLSALENLNAIAKVLESARVKLPIVLHGTEATSWPIMDEAIARGYDLRIGLEDTLVLPDGRMAKDNGELVREAVRRVRERAGANPPS